MSEFRFKDTATLLRAIKKLEKRYPQISNDVTEFTKTIHSKDDLGTSQAILKI